jgi:hypothetical protein
MMLTVQKIQLKLLARKDFLHLHECKLSSFWVAY